jgi:alpha-beta hydrolase superfamily lysophospholipase
MECFKLSSAQDDLDISIAVSRPKGTPRAIVQLVHGMCCCKEKFGPVMEFLSSNGVVCISSDLRGHGQSVKSSSDWGYFYSGGYKALVDDLRIVTMWGVEKFPGLPLFLLGYSMGSMAARIYAKQDDTVLSGLIVCASPSKVPMYALGKFLTGIVCYAGFERNNSGVLQDIVDNFYNRRFTDEGPHAWVCSDPESRRRFMNMPQCNFKFTMNGVNNLMKMMADTYSLDGWKVANPTMPVLFISGADDPIMISERRLQDAVSDMRRVGYTNVAYSIYPKMRHDILDDRNKRDVWNQVLNFVKSR